VLHFSPWELVGCPSSDFCRGYAKEQANVWKCVGVYGQISVRINFPGDLTDPSNLTRKPRSFGSHFGEGQKASAPEKFPRFEINRGSNADR
jgi:hypothetical protein